MSKNYYNTTVIECNLHLRRLSYNDCYTTKTKVGSSQSSSPLYNYSQTIERFSKVNEHKCTTHLHIYLQTPPVEPDNASICQHEYCYIDFKRGK